MAILFLLHIERKRIKTNQVSQTRLLSYEDKEKQRKRAREKENYILSLQILLAFGKFLKNLNK